MADKYTSGYSGREIDEAVGRALRPYVNDLTTGGIDSGLSAEQGKVLKGLITTAQTAADTAQNTATEAQGSADEAYVRGNNAYNLATGHTTDIFNLQSGLNARMYFNGNVLLGEDDHPTLSLVDFLSETMVGPGYNYMKKAGVVVALVTRTGPQLWQWDGTRWGDAGAWREIGATVVDGGEGEPIDLSGYALRSELKTQYIIYDGQDTDLKDKDLEELIDFHLAYKGLVVKIDGDKASLTAREIHFAHSVGRLVTAVEGQAVYHLTSSHPETVIFELTEAETDSIFSLSIDEKGNVFERFHKQFPQWVDLESNYYTRADVDARLPQVAAIDVRVVDALWGKITSAADSMTAAGTYDGELSALEGGGIGGGEQGGTIGN